MAAPTIPPLRKSVTVPWTQQASFRRFTEDIASWWPLRTHSVGEERAESVVFEGRPGGRIYEKIKGGAEATWGSVTAWEPPSRIAFAWHPGQDASRAQAVEVRFVPVEAGTRLELTHTGWERLGEMARRARRAYPLGWAYVLRLYAGRRSSLFVKSVDALMWLFRPLQRRAARKLAEQGALEPGSKP